MECVTLPSGFYNSPEVIRAGTLATGLFIAAVSYSVEQKTEGLITARTVDYLAWDAGEYVGNAEPDKAVARMLVRSGLFDQDEDGDYLIVGFSKYHYDDGLELS